MSAPPRAGGQSRSWRMVLVALAASLAGCGSGGAPPGTGIPSTASRPLTPTAILVRSAADKTLATSAKLLIDLRGAHDFGSSRAPVASLGQFDFSRARGEEKIDLGEVGRAEPGNEQAMFLDGRVYLQPRSPTGAVLPKGKQWELAVLSGSDAVSTNFPSFVLQAEAINPQFLLSELATGTVAATQGSSATVGNQRATRYQATIDLTSSLQAMTSSATAAFAQAVRTELAADSTGLPVTIDLAIDGAGRVVEMRTSPPGADEGVARMRMCCFGVAVDLAAPSPESVIDIGSLTPSGERENNQGGDSDGG